MLTLKNATYRGVTFDFQGEAKQDLVEALAGIDYLVTRDNAPEHTPDTAGKNDTGEGKAKPKAKSTTRRKAAAKKAEEPAKEEAEEPAKEEAASDQAQDKGEAAAEETQEAAKEDEAKSFTVEQVKERLQQYIEAFGAPQAKELLSRYDVKKRSELTDEQVPQFMAEMEERLEAGG